MKFHYEFKMDIEKLVGLNVAEMLMNLGLLSQRNSGYFKEHQMKLGSSVMLSERSGERMNSVETRIKERLAVLENYEKLQEEVSSLRQKIAIMESVPNEQGEIDVMVTPITAVDINAQNKSRLMKSGIATIGDAVKLGRAELAKIPYFGNKGMIALEAALVRFKVVLEP